MMSAIKNLLILSVITYFFITTPPFTWVEETSNKKFTEWWNQSEPLMTKLDSESSNFIIEGRIDSKVYRYKLTHNSGNDELFGRLVRLIQDSGLFEKITSFNERSIALRITGNGESFERSFSKEDADSNFKLKLLFKILAENQSEEPSTELAKDENNQDKKGS